MANETYITAVAESGLPNSRNLTASGGLQATDNGAGSNFNISTTGTLAAISALSGTGLICLTGTGTVAARTIASSSTTSITNPDGANGNIQVNVINSSSLQNVQAMLNGSIPGGVTPTSYLNFVAGTGITISVANGTYGGITTQDVTITSQPSTGAPVTAQYLLAATNSTLTNAQVLTPAAGSLILGTNGTTWGTLTIGANGTILTSNGTTASWQPASGSSGANANGYYVVTQATNAPVNAVSLSDVGTGLLYSTVSGGVATLGTTTTTSATIYMGAGNPVRVGVSSGSQVSTLDVSGDRASFWLDATSNAATIPNAGGVFTFDSTGKLSLTTSNANNKSGQVVINGSGSTAVGDILIGNANGIMQSLAIGATGTVLTSNGTTATWAAPALPPVGYNLVIGSGGVGTADIPNATITATSAITGSAAFQSLISNTANTGTLVINYYATSPTITVNASSSQNWCFFRVGTTSSGAPTPTQMTSSGHGYIATAGTNTSTQITGINLIIPLADITGSGNTSLLLYVYTSSSDTVSTFSIDFVSGYLEAIYYPTGLL